MGGSDIYLFVVEQGQKKHARKAVLLLGTKKLGPPDDSIRTRLASITDLERLDRMMLRASTAASWEEILNTPCGPVIPIDDGPVEEAKRFLLGLGEIGLGPADLLARMGLDCITDLERLERMTLRLRTAASWGEVLDTP